MCARRVGWNPTRRTYPASDVDGDKIMTTTSTPLACAQLRAANSPNDTSNPSTLQSLAADAATKSNMRDDNKPLRLALLFAGILLSLVSVALAAQAGWHRGATQLEQTVWAAAGVALAIVSLTGLSAARQCSETMRRAALGAWLLALAFVLVSGLGSQHGGRELASRTDTAATGDRTRAEAAYTRAGSELAALPAARPVGVLENELSSILQDTRLKGCSGWLENKRLRTICVERVEPIRVELETAKARAEAQQDMDGATTALAAAKPTTPANSDAASLDRYLSLFSIKLEPDRIADWLNLLTVCAVELVGAVALALGRQLSMADARPAGALQPATTDARPDVNAETESAPTDPESAQPDQPTDRPSPKGGLAVGTDADRRRARVVQTLMDGALTGTQEAIAARVGLPKTTMRRIVETDARLRLTVGPQGSRLELANA